VESFNGQSLPLDDVLPWFLLGLFVYALLELIYVYYYKHKARLGEYGMSAKGLGFNILVGIGITTLYGPFSKTLLALYGASLAPFHVGLSPLGCIYGFILYELAYWLQHWLAHKVRLLWCLHSPHHAPQAMHMFVGFNHSFLESIFYMPLLTGFIPALLGVDPVFIVVISFIDIMWGNFLHVSDNVLTRRLGFLERFLQTPSYHRVHHAQNVRYLDTNYNSITLLGDWLMGTLQPLDDKEPVRFGITREVNTSSFWDVHFGEFRLLWNDVCSASSVRGVFGYLFCAPGWSPEGEQQTAAARKLREFGAGKTAVLEPSRS
jgi:sterol desaturase/sphingolipid hydroxylase (fatty acid hydroxylase superfamily)